MNFYVAALLLWLVIVPVTILACAGLWRLCANGWQHRQAAKLWDDFDKVGVGGGPVPRRVRGPAGTPTPTPPYDWSKDAA